jgi:hypothetical protein
MALMFKNPSSSFKPLTLWKIWRLLVLVVVYAAAGVVQRGRYLCIPSWWQGTECHSIEPTGVSSSPFSAERRSCRSRAQQTDRVPGIGVLARTLIVKARIALSAFRDTLQRLGLTDGRNVSIDARWGAGDPDRIRSYSKPVATSSGLSATATLIRRVLRQRKGPVRRLLDTAHDCCSGQYARAKGE